MRNIKLNNGVEMPMLGFGVYQVTDLKVCEESVYQAITTGYRSIDTAAMYQNEPAVGRAIKRSGVKREELFITTKLWIQDADYERAKLAFKRSTENLEVDYLDLYLIHQPYGDIFGAWRAMQELYKEGKIRAIGISNFPPDRVMDFANKVEIRPVINQLEVNPFFQQIDTQEFLKTQDIQLEAWAPFGEGRNDLFENPVLAQIAQAHNKSIGQVVLRWLNQRNIITIPKSVHKERIEENFQIFDFNLTDQEMNLIQTLDMGKSLFLDHRDPATVKYLSDMKF